MGPSASSVRCVLWIPVIAFLLGSQFQSPCVADSSPLGQFDNMAVGVANQNSLADSQVCAWEIDDAGRDESKLTIARRLSCGGNILSEYAGLPMRDVIGFRADRHGASISRRQVLEELDPWAGTCAQSGDP